MSFAAKGVFATLPNAQRGVPLVINGDPKGKNMLYCNGKVVVIRDIENPGLAETYIQHSVPATVARYAPSGYYIASGDASGKIRIWDTTQKEHILKYEYQPISGAIKDIVWSPDSKRIAICGQGREKFGHVFLWDSGSSVGEITGHSKFLNSIDYRPVRPFRVVTAGEDKTIGFFEGPPFRYKTSLRDHSQFVNAIRFSPDGERFCSGGADGKAFLYDGKTGEKLAALGGDRAHAGGIYSLSWGPDGNQLLTASGDKTCKLWDVTTSQVVTEFKMGSAVEDQQVSCLWQGAYLLSVSVSGSINYLDVNNPSTPLRIVRGHKKNLTSLVVSSDSATVYGGSFDGRVSHWSVSEGEVGWVSGAAHTAEVCSMVATPDKLYTLGLDKSFKTALTATNEFSAESLGLPDRDPTGLAVGSDGLAVIVTKQEVIVACRGSRVSSFTPKYEPACVTFHPSLPEVAIGGKDRSVHIYTVSGSNLSEKTKFSVAGEISTIAYSPDGESLAVSSDRTILIFDSASYQEKHSMLFHTARVLCLAWSADSLRIVSGSIDTNICVWNATKGERTQMIKGAHPLSVVTGVAWISDSMFASSGHDCCIRIWEQS